MHIQPSPRTAFTLIEIMIVVAIIGLLASIAIPSLIRASEKTKQTTCILNLKAIEGAKVNWALEAKRSTTETPTDGDLFGATLYMQAKPGCPANGTYSLNQVDTKPVCSMPTHTL